MAGKTTARIDNPAIGMLEALPLLSEAAAAAADAEAAEADAADADAEEDATPLSLSPPHTVPAMPWRFDEGMVKSPELTAGAGFVE